MGLDSLERMEILASLEETFGGRFPEDILPAARNLPRRWSTAVENYLGPTPRARAERPAGRRDPAASTIASTCFPSIVEAASRRWTCSSTAGLTQPVLHGPRAASPTTRTLIGGRELINFSSYNYLGMSGDPRRGRGRQGGHRPLRHQRLGQPAGLGRKDRSTASWNRPSPSSSAPSDAIVFVGGHATNETVIGHLFGPGDLILHDALAHNSIVQGRDPLGRRRRPFPHNDWRGARPAAGRAPARVSPRADRDRRRLQHGRRHPRPAAVHRGQETAQGAS